MSSMIRSPASLAPKAENHLSPLPWVALYGFASCDTVPFFWELFILPDGDTDSDWFHAEVSRPGLWNDFPDTVIAVSMLCSKEEYISRMKNDILVGTEALKSSKLKDPILPKTY